MKTKIISIALLFAIMALLPFTVSKCAGTENVFKKTTATADIVQKDEVNEQLSTDEILCGLVAAQYKNNYSTETLKAIAIILNTNYKLNPDSFDLDDKNVCLYKKDANNSVKEIYDQISDAVNSVKEKTLCINSKAFYIPYGEISNGHTQASEEYSYITSVASPWDCFSENYDENAQCIGASLCGIDYLCKNGSGYEDALKWYLPQFEITN